MNKFFTILITSIGLSFTCSNVNAQWNILSNLFMKMDTTTNKQFFNDLGALNAQDPLGTLNHFEQLTGLINGVKGNTIGGVLDSSYLEALQAGKVLLGGVTGIPAADKDTLLGEYGRIQSLYNGNFNSLGSIFGKYRDSMLMQNPSWSGGYFGGIPNVNLGNKLLQDTFKLVSGSVPANGPKGFAPLLGQIFNKFSFPLLELAFGTQAADLRYYNDTYSANAKVIRFGSVLGFNSSIEPHKWQGIFGLYPLEASWHIEASWLKEPTQNAIANGEALAATDPNKINPLVLNGDFNIIMSPYFISLANVPFRIFTSLGMEFGTYAPAHNNYPHKPALTTPNKGFTTGFGPQVGLGFAFTTGALVLYSHNTLAHGTMYNNIGQAHPTYKYNSIKFEAGMRYGNYVNIRYSRGNASWAPNNNKSGVIKNQVTIGIILPELHH